LNHYDIIGDIHGHAEELKALLFDMGYNRRGGGYRHTDRKVMFVGDFVDRGPAIGEVVDIARAMVESGDALAVMGNHEYNAISFHTAVPGRSSKYFRDHSVKNCGQHQQTLFQLSCGELNDAIEWFKTLPVAIEVGGIRVAHASWQTRDIDCINQALSTEGKFTPEFLAMAEDAGSDLNTAIENVLKGPELPLPRGYSIQDKGGHKRNSVRIKWYEDGSGRTYSQHHLGSDKVPNVSIDPSDLATVETYPPDAVLECPHFLVHRYESRDWGIGFALGCFRSGSVATGAEAAQCEANTAGGMPPSPLCGRRWL